MICLLYAETVPGTGQRHSEKEKEGEEEKEIIERHRDRTKGNELGKQER